MVTLKEYEIYLKVKAFIETEGCQRDSKRWVLVKINTFGGTLWCAPRFMQDTKSPKITISLLII